MTLLKYSQRKLAFLTILITIEVLLLGFVCTGMFSKTSMRVSAIGTNAIGISTISSEHQKQCCTISVSSVSNHTISWNDIALTQRDKLRDAWTLLLLSLALIFGYSLVSSWNRRPPAELDVSRLRHYIRENPNLILFNPLRLAYARGILNPKIY